MGSEFDDVVEAQQGIFGADCGGLCPEVYGSRDKVNARPKPEGVELTFACPRCGISKQIVVEYPELLAIQYNISPHIAYNGTSVLAQPVEWSYDRDHLAWYPNMICSTSTCGQPIPILISSAEAGRYTQLATQNRWMPQRAQLENHIRSLLQQQQVRR